jgi:hypothetical protein
LSPTFCPIITFSPHRSRISLEARCVHTRGH